MPQDGANARIDRVRFTGMIVTSLLCARLAVAQPPPSSERVVCARSPRAVPCDLVRPVTSARAPLVILVHGRSGMSFYAERLGGLARRLAASGFVVLIPHYFEATGDADKPEITAEWFGKWLATLGEVIDFGSALDGVDSKRVGLSGFSLGAYLSITRAAEDRRIGAVVSNSGGLPDGFPERVPRMPPVLIIHAAEDPIASVQSMRRLEKRLRKTGVPTEVLLYPSRDHILEGDAWTDAAGKMTEFLRTTLAPVR